MTPVRPFMRYLAPNVTPLTKLYRLDKFSLPIVSDPALLRTWADERSPTATEEFLFTKILVRPAEAGTDPL